MPGKRRPVIDLVAAIGDEAAEHQDPPSPPAPAPAAGPAAAVALADPPAPQPQAAPAAAPEAAKPAWDARMSLTLSRDMKRALDIARAEDGIEGTARIRAMIALWEKDERLRRRIDRDARSYR